MDKDVNNYVIFSGVDGYARDAFNSLATLLSQIPVMKTHGWDMPVEAGSYNSWMGCQFDHKQVAHGGYNAALCRFVDGKEIAIVKFHTRGASGRELVKLSSSHPCAIVTEDSDEDGAFIEYFNNPLSGKRELFFQDEDAGEYFDARMDMIVEKLGVKVKPTGMSVSGSFTTVDFDSIDLRYNPKNSQH